MLISEKKLRSMIRNAILSEVGPGPGMDPTRATAPRGKVASTWESDLSILDPQIMLGFADILDPTGAVSIISAALYAMDGDHTSAALSLGLGATGAVIRRFVNTAKALKVSDDAIESAVAASRRATPGKQKIIHPQARAVAQRQGSKITNAVASVKNSFNMMKNMKLGTTTTLKDDLYVFLAATPNTEKISSGFVRPSMGMAGRTRQTGAIARGGPHEQAEAILDKVRPTSAVGRQDTVYLSPWSEAGSWSRWGSDVYLVKVPRGSKITYVDGFDATEVVDAVKLGGTDKYGRSVAEVAEEYWKGRGSSGAPGGGEILTKARVEVLGRAKDILSKDILDATTAWEALY